VIPPGGVLITTTGPARIGVRRFADTFETVGTLPSAGKAALRFRQDRSGTRWRMSISSARQATVCTLGH
jgi:hypothetical protein